MKKETILSAVQQYENDAVIITHLIGKEKEDIYTRGGHGHRTFFGYSLDPGYSSTKTTVRLETNLYDAKTGALIWSGNSQTFSRDETDQIMNDIIKAVVQNMQKDNLITPK